MKHEIVKVNPKEFGLEEIKAAQIAAQFKPMLDKMVELEKEANEVFNMDVEDTVTAAKAKEVRLKYVKVRTGTAAIHKEQKAFYLAGGKFVDGWKNAQIFASEGVENKLMSIEKHAENVEKERIENLHNERVELCKPFVQNEMEILPDLGNLPDSIWVNYITGLETSYKARIEAEKKAEYERLEAERIEKLRWERSELIKPYYNFFNDDNSIQLGELHTDEFNKLISDLKKQKTDYEKEQEKIRLENEGLKKEAEAKEKQAEKERIERERLAKIETDKQAKILADEKAKADKLAAELKAKEDAERDESLRLANIAKEEKEAERLANIAPEKDKITKWIDSFEIGLIVSNGFSVSGKATVNLIEQKFEAFKKWANDQKETIK